MKPVLSAWPAKKRTNFFAPFVLGIFVVSFLIVALGTQNIFLAFLIPPVIAVGGAYALLGWPQIQTKDGKPLIEPRYKPYLFFVLAPIFSLALYPIVGLLLMTVGIPPTKWVAILSILLALGLGIAGAYFLVGIPNIYASARRQYAAIPPERRPFLFFPLFVVFFLVLYLALGVATNRLLPINIQILILMPACLALAGVLAWLLVGIPKAITAPAHHLPKVTGKHRPRAFFFTFLLVGIPLTLILGTLLTNYSPLPSMLVLALALVLGYVCSMGIALLAWGTPASWRRYDDYEPALPATARMPLRIAGAIVLGIAVALGLGIAGIDLFWGLLVGLVVAGLAIVLLTGAHRRVLARRGQATLVPDLPDAMKPLILFPTWFLIALLLFAVLTYVLPGLVGFNALIAILVGLAVAFLLLEQPLLKEVRAERARERQKRRDWEARRKARLEEAEKGSAPSPPEG